MKDWLAILTVLAWPIIPLFWIPVHGFSKIFKKIGIFTYFIPASIYPFLAYFIYSHKDYIVNFKINLPVGFQVLGYPLFLIGLLLHIWTGILLNFWGLIGLPEISTKYKGKLVTEGAFNIVRHPTYLAHTLIFLGVFLITEVLTVGIVTLLDFIVINLIVIPLEERELYVRFGKDYENYKEKVRDRILPLRKVLLFFLRT